MVGKIIGIAVCFTAIVTQAGAQGLNIELDGGLQGMQYMLSAGSAKPLPGGSLGLLYTFRLKSPLDLITGITGGAYQTQASLPNGTVFTNYQVDDEGSAFRYSMKAAGYKETQRFFAAGIPVLLQYHTAAAGIQWYLNAGGKVLFPSTVRSLISAQQLTLSGYYPDYNINVSNLPQHGFGVLNNWKASAATVLKPAAALSAATGFGFGLPHGMRLYAGLYVDYGLTALKGKSDTMPFVSYSSTGIGAIKAGSVLNMPNSGQAKLLSFGLQLRLSLAPSRAKPAGKPKEVLTVTMSRSPDITATMPPSPDTTAIKPPPPDTTTMMPLSTDTTVIMPSYYDSLGIGYDEAVFIEQPVIFGAVDEVAIPQVGQAHLDKLAAILTQHPKIRLSLMGHICNSETETEDPKVAQARVKAVARYLMSKGIRRSRMDVTALKESDPVQPNNPPANYRKRRVAIKVE